MKSSIQNSLFSLATLAALTLVPFHAEAKCQKMGFLVNDYGKDGPSKDAQDLLEKHVAKWAEENKISKYTMGKKQVSCELFLNFVVFDEHTCTASANVCWDEANVGSKGKKTLATSQSQETNKKQNTIKTTETTSDKTSETASDKTSETSPEQSSSPTPTKVTKSETVGTDINPTESTTPSSSDTIPNVSNTEASKKENVQSGTTEKPNPGPASKTSTATAPEDVIKSLNESKTTENCAEKSSTTSTTKVKAVEPVKAKAKPPAPKKTKPEDTPETEAIEEASNTDESETGSSDIETGSLPFFSIGKDNQPEFSRNPLNQNN